MLVSKESYIHADIDNSDDYASFFRDLALGNPLKNVTEMKVTAFRKPDDIFSSGLWTFVSEKLVNILFDLGADDCIQTFKAKVKLRNGKDCGSYFALHVIKKVDCFDVSNSKYGELRGGAYSQIEKLEILQDKVSSTDFIFRIENVAKNTVILNAVAVDLFEKSKLRGLKLLAFDEFNRTLRIRMT